MARQAWVYGGVPDPGAAEISIVSGTPVYPTGELGVQASAGSGATVTAGSAPSAVE